MGLNNCPQKSPQNKSPDESEPQPKIRISRVQKSGHAVYAGSKYHIELRLVMYIYGAGDGALVHRLRYYRRSCTARERERGPLQCQTTGTLYNKGRPHKRGQSMDNSFYSRAMPNFDTPNFAAYRLLFFLLEYAFVWLGRGLPRCLVVYWCLMICSKGWVFSFCTYTEKNTYCFGWIEENWIFYIIVCWFSFDPRQI